MGTGPISAISKYIQATPLVSPDKPPSNLPLAVESFSDWNRVVDRFSGIPAVAPVAQTLYFYQTSLRNTLSQMDFTPVEASEEKTDWLQMGAGVVLTGAAIFLLGPATALAVGGAFLLSGCGGAPEPDWDIFFQETPVSIEELMESISIPAEDSEAFQELTQAQLVDFYELVAGILQGEFPDVASLNALDYELINVSFDDQLVMALVHHKNFGGTYFINHSTDSTRVFEVPHPLYEDHTLEEGIHLFKQGQAKALLIAGTHRCANKEYSPCDGKTDVCGGPGFRISDVAHYHKNYFQKAHEALYDQLKGSVAFQLHGFESVSGTAYLSNGTSTDFTMDILSNQLTLALEREISSKEAVISCNRAGDPDNLCGTTNVQGRYSNGGSNICENAATESSNRFIHLEQSAWIRDPNRWRYLVKALDLALKD